MYTRDKTSGAAKFHFVEPPSAADLTQMVTTICERVCRMLGRRGLLGEANHESNEADTTPDALQACRKVSLSRGRFERLDERGRAQQQLFPDDEQGMRRKKDGRWTADFKGFSLNAEVNFSALDGCGPYPLVTVCSRLAGHQLPAASRGQRVLGPGTAHTDGAPRHTGIDRVDGVRPMTGCLSPHAVLRSVVLKLLDDGTLVLGRRSVHVGATHCVSTLPTIRWP